MNTSQVDIFYYYYILMMNSMSLLLTKNRSNMIQDALKKFISKLTYFNAFKSKEHNKSLIIKISIRNFFIQNYFLMSCTFYIKFI